MSEERVEQTGPEEQYKIKGMMVQRSDGTLEKTKMFEIFDIPLDDYSDLSFSLEEVRRMRMHLMKMRTGIQAMAPLLCGGPVRCPFKFRCPLVDRTITTADGKIDFHRQDGKKFPLMRQCIFEREFIEFKRQQYVDEYDVDIESPTEMGMINKLAELDLYEYRATLVLAHGDDNGEGIDLMKKQVTGVSEDGREIKRLEIHPAFELKERLHKMREDILTSMVGTRREKYKQAAALKQADSSDASVLFSNLKEHLQRMESDSVIEAEIVERSNDDK